MFAQALARTAQIYGNRPATISTAGVQTWRDFVDRIQSVAAGLRGLALQPGDRVAILAGNTAEHLTMMYAVAWAWVVCWFHSTSGFPVRKWRRSSMNQVLLRLLVMGAQVKALTSSPLQ